jgi:CPA2 family monovalent cation:H+ antiporter-2
MADVLLIKTLVVILASVSSISLVVRAGLPAAGGYLLAGLVIGPHGLHLIATSDETRFLAELGIIFLMFMVGLEFSFSAMIAARRDVFVAGSLQVGLTALIVAGIAMLGHWVTHRCAARRRGRHVIDRHHAQAIGRPGRRQ